jgi:hypothetical protein
MSSNVLILPAEVPTREQLFAPRIELAVLASTVASEVLQYTEGLITAENAAQLATAVDRLAGKLAEASATWAGLSRMIRENWYR